MPPLISCLNKRLLALPQCGEDFILFDIAPIASHSKEHSTGKQVIRAALGSQLSETRRLPGCASGSRARSSQQCSLSKFASCRPRESDKNEASTPVSIPDNGVHLRLLLYSKLRILLYTS